MTHRGCRTLRSAGPMVLPTCGGRQATTRPDAAAELAAARSRWGSNDEVLAPELGRGFLPRPEPAAARTRHLLPYAGGTSKM